MAKLRRHRVIRFLLIAAVVSAGIWLLCPRVGPAPARQDPCANNLRLCALALDLYAKQHRGRYPPPIKWNDFILPYIDDAERYMVCPKAPSGRCSYALNPLCKPDSPKDVVLLFESKPGWNLSGGPQLLNTANHNTGCHVAFNDRHVQFVKTQNLPNLNWGTEPNDRR